MITITVNGEPRELPPQSSLAQLVEALGQAPQALATAINGEFVPRDARAQCQLSNGDAVFTFQPITGG